jgi:hypothetical protein
MAVKRVNKPKPAKRSRQREEAATRIAWLNAMAECPTLPESEWRALADQYDIVPQVVLNARLLYDVTRKTLMEAEEAFLMDQENTVDEKRNANVRTCLKLLVPPAPAVEERSIARYVLFMRSLDVLVKRGATSFAAARLPLRYKRGARVVIRDTAFKVASEHRKAVPAGFTYLEVQQIEAETERALFERWPDTTAGRGKASKFSIVRDAGIQMGWPKQEIDTLKNYWKNRQKHPEE